MKPLTLHVNGEFLWKLGRMQKDVFQFIPPELALCPQTACDDEYVGGYVGGLQQRLGVVKIVGIAVVERNRDRTRGDFLFSRCISKRSKGHRAGVSPQDIQMFGKMLPGNRKEQRIRFQFCDAVVEQDHRTANRRISGSHPLLIVLLFRKVQH